MVTPSRLPLGRCTTFKKPGESPSVSQRSVWSMGQVAALTLSPWRSLAWTSVRPTWATSGSVNVAQGTRSSTDLLLKGKKAFRTAMNP